MPLTIMYVMEKKWNKTNLKFYLNNNSTHLTAQERESAINYALSQWADVSEFTFQRVYNEDNADIRINGITISNQIQH